MVVHSMFDDMSWWFCSCHEGSFHALVVLFMPCGFMTCHGGFVHAMWVSRMSWWFYSCHEGSFHVMVVLFMPHGFITCHGFIDHVMMTYYMSWCLFSCHGHLLHVMAVFEQQTLGFNHHKPTICCFFVFTMIHYVLWKNNGGFNSFQLISTLEEFKKHGTELATHGYCGGRIRNPPMHKCITNIWRDLCLQRIAKHDAFRPRKLAEHDDPND